MRKLLFFFSLSILLGQVYPALAQQVAKPVYMQIFYEGSSWLSGKEVLHYSPAFRGKTGEVVQEPDSIRQISPNARMQWTDEATTTTSYATVTTDKGTFIPDRDGKVHLQTAAEHKLARQQEQNQFNRGLNLLETRANLGRTTLSKSLNDAFAEGWEVVQMTAWGTQGGLVYLLRRR